MTGVTLTGAVKRYSDVPVIQGVDLKIDDGEFCVFVGPSGCGKSTLLRMIAGLEDTSAGTIEIGARDVTHVDPAKRGVAMVFQSYALYPHMTVAENMGFGLRMNGVAKDEVNRKVGEAARILKLDPYLKRKPKALSGGQRQRVAIGRAIVRGPGVFLFDEPLSNLDAELRVEMRVEIARLHKEIGATMIYVTHDQVEAMTLADKIVVLRAGRIEQVGAPLHLYRDPDTKFVAGFIGSPAMNFLDGTEAGGTITVPGLGGATVPAPASLIGTGKAITVGIRPQHLRVDSAGDTHEVEVAESLGDVSYIYLRARTGEKLIAARGEEDPPRTGACLAITIDPARVLLFDPETEARIRADRVHMDA
jgi:lactose/L-arabinose transport system ATP-binding protein